MTVLLLGGAAFAYERREDGHTPMSVDLCIGVAALLVMHLAAGAILGVLD